MKKTLLLCLGLGLLNQVAIAQVEINPDYYGNGGEILVRAPEGSSYFTLQPDFDGSGGYVNVSDGNGGIAFEIDGKYEGDRARVRIQGTSTTLFNTYDTGNNSVVLPNDAVNSTEIFNEPGVAMNDNNGIVTLTSTLSSVISRTITVPSDGYVLVMAAGRFGVTHTTGTTSYALFGLSSNGTYFAASQDLDIQIPSSQPTGLFYIPFSAQRVFPVSSGSRTFYLLGEETFGDINMADITLTCLFIPTKYGTVSSEVAVLSQAENGDDKPVDKVNSVSSAQEKETSVAENLARIQKEMDELKALILSQKPSGNNPNSK